MNSRPDAHLWRALALGDPPAGAPPVVAVVGGGGKTTLVYRLAAEAAGMGRRAVVTGTTRFTPAEAPLEMPPLIRTPQADAPRNVIAQWSRHPEVGILVVAGDRDQPEGRLDPLEPEVIDRIRALPGLGLVAVEADGSKMRPFKAPAAHEPVVPEGATHVVAVVGVDAVGAPLDARRVHRPECVRALLGRPEGDESPLTVQEIARVLVHPDGGRRHAGSRPFTVMVNKADRDPEAARALAAAVRAHGVRVVVTALRTPREAGGPVVAILD